MEAPKLETITSILAEYELPLLVQQRSGRKLLLYKSQHVPCLVCQELSYSSADDSDFSTDQRLFILPLNNTGYYSGVTPSGEVTTPYTSLTSVIESVGESPCHVLSTDLLPIVKYYGNSKKPLEISLLPGEEILLNKRSRCSTLDQSQNSLACCLYQSNRQTAENTICVHDNKRHIHVGDESKGKFYVVSKEIYGKLRDGCVYSLKDIAQHIQLPKRIGCIYNKEETNDEIKVPKIFRMLKTIGNTVVFAFPLYDGNYPRPEDATQISEYSKELFAIAESEQVNMDDIRGCQLKMAIHRVIPESTISLDDYYEIESLARRLNSEDVLTRLSSSTTNKLNIKSNHNTENEKDKVNFSSLSNGKKDCPQLPSPTVPLPTRTVTERTIIKRLGTFIQRKKSRPTLRSLSARFQSNDYRDEWTKEATPTRRSIKGLDIVHPHMQHNVTEPSQIELAASDTSFETYSTDSAFSTSSVQC